MKNQQGFTLLEAIVALVLLAGIGGALFAWISTSMNSLRKVSEYTERQLLVQNALAYMESVNPLQSPKGSAALGRYELRWQATVAQPVRQAIGNQGETTLFTVGLFNTEVELLQDKQRYYAFTLRQIGYQRVAVLPTL